MAKSKLLDAIRSQSSDKEEVKQPGKIDQLMIESALSKLFFYERHLREDRIGLHASSIIAEKSRFCYREQVLSLFYKQTDGDIPLMLRRIFEQGTAMHEKWQKLFQINEIAYGIEYRCFSTLWDMYLTPDAIIEINGRNYICEIKSMNGFSHQKATDHPSGAKQLNLYMHFTGIHKGFVLGDNKNDQSVKVFYHEYDPVAVRPYLKRLKDIQTYKRLYLKEPELPDRLCDSYTCNRAKSCNMRDACFNKGIGKVMLPDTLIKHPKWYKE